MHVHTTSEVCVWVPTSGHCVWFFGLVCWHAPFFVVVGFVLFESGALPLLTIGAQVLGLGALGLGVVALDLMGVVALGGFRSTGRRHLLEASQMSYFVTNPKKMNGALAIDPAAWVGSGGSDIDRHSPALCQASFVFPKNKKIKKKINI